MTETIPFNRPLVTGREAGYIAEALEHAHISSGGAFSGLAGQLIRELTSAGGVLLVNSCTAALEIAALLLECGPGDEVVMPSYTFVTTATAFVMRGATPVFVDVRPDTLNIDETLVEAAITARTKAIVTVHYAGVACAMAPIADVAERHGIAIVEDAAQGILASGAGRPLGTFGALGALSFHETKNVTCGEGGALLVNDPRLAERAEILREKGTNRSRFFRGEVDKYTWVDLGSSFALSDLAAAFLVAQLEQAAPITERRLAIWRRYHEAFEPLEAAGAVRRPVVPEGCRHNAHMYYLLAPDARRRAELIADLNADGVNAVFHYVPLHSSPAGRRYARVSGSLAHTDDLSDRILRLPLWPGMTEAEIDRVIEAVRTAATAPARR